MNRLRRKNICRTSLAVAVETLETRQLLTSVQQFPLPSYQFVGQMAAGPGGDVWYISKTGAARDIGYPGTDFLQHITPNGTFKAHLPIDAAGVIMSPRALASGPDGSLYVLTDSTAGNQYSLGLDRVNPDGSVTVIPLSYPILNSEYLKYPDNNVPAGAENGPIFTTIDFVVGGNGNVYIGAGQPSGGGVGNFDFIDKITPDGIVTPVDTGHYTLGPIAVSQNGTIFTAYGSATPAGVFTKFAAPMGGVIQSMVGAADGNVYFTETLTNVNPNAGSLVGIITPSGKITTYPLSNPGGSVGAISRGPNGDAIFTETARSSNGANQPLIYKIGEINASGIVSETTVNNSTFAYVDGDSGAITVGPNGQIWFAENDYTDLRSAIGELVLPQSSLLVTAVPQVTVHQNSTDIVLTLSAAANANSVRDLRNYRLETIAAPGRASHVVKVQATYDKVHNSIVLRVRGHLNPAQNYQLTVNGSGSHAVSSVQGVKLSGNGLGLPGSNFRAIISGRRS